ncbi:hypothetical protein, partial [Bradyrhizobium sp.]|uniref:hypothetical protein n=1 Tax=Bradyrhizobium sp. TaxID=376 RepID=UPI003C16BD74
DTFVFRPGLGAEVIANAPSAPIIELDGFSSLTSNAQLAALLSEAQAGQPQSLFQSTIGGHDTVINLGNHDSITLTNLSISELHASSFIIH